MGVMEFSFLRMTIQETFVQKLGGTCTYMYCLCVYQVVQGLSVSNDDTIPISVSPMATSPPEIEEWVFQSDMDSNTSRGETASGSGRSRTASSSTGLSVSGSGSERATSEGPTEVEGEESLPRAETPTTAATAENSQQTLGSRWVSIDVQIVCVSHTKLCLTGRHVLLELLPHDLAHSSMATVSVCQS